MVAKITFGQQQKYALVIGAQNYVSLPPLRNSLADAKDFANALRAKGFQVETLLDPKTNREIKDAIIRYKSAMAEVVGGVGIIFYAGHGMQYEGNNYIIPTSVKLELPSDLDNQCLKMNNVMSVLQVTNKSLNILFLDACRTIPSFNRDSEQGWIRENAPRGSIIVFATEAGKVASDGNAKNGLFTSKLLTRINEPGLNIGDLLSKVKEDVFIESNEKQLPTVDDRSISANFIFTPATEGNNTRPTKQPIVKSEPAYVVPVTTALDYGYGPSNAPTVHVGTQEWFAKNLNIDRFTNGDLIPEAKTAEEWKRAGENKQPAWCYYNNELSNGHTLGKLYNWYAVSDARGLAPIGWHIASDAEWRILTDYLGGKVTAGPQVKSTSGWNGNGNGNNNSGITGLPGGNRSSSGSFTTLGAWGCWWTSTETDTITAWDRSLLFSEPSLGRGNNLKGNGQSVRCVKD